jgi:hypothetical protein
VMTTYKKASVSAKRSPSRLDTKSHRKPLSSASSMSETLHQRRECSVLHSDFPKKSHLHPESHCLQDNSNKMFHVVITRTIYHQCSKKLSTNSFRSNAGDSKLSRQNTGARRSCVCVSQWIKRSRCPQETPRRSSTVSSSGSSNGDLTLVGSSIDDRGLITYSAGPMLRRAGLASYTLALLEYSVLANDL